MSASGLPLLNSSHNFVGGKIHKARLQWHALSRDRWIHDAVDGKVLDFDSLPRQEGLPPPLQLSVADTLALDTALVGFLQCNIVERCEPQVRGFVSNVFPVIKKDGTARVILNLKELNDYITHIHFKMDSIRDVIQLVRPNCFFSTIDFKDAYFSVFITPEDRIWLQFRWRNDYFRFTCLPQGLTSAPRIFTKLLKPALAHLRSLGICVICYIDDCIFIAASAHELKVNVRYALEFFYSLGLTINVQKSVLDPTQVVEFLGIVLNSVSMTATLPRRRREHIKAQGRLLLQAGVTLHDLASFIGMTVASNPAVELAPLRYKYLEILRNRELARNHGDYRANILLDSHARKLVTWWINNIDSQSRSLRSSSPQIELFSDACLTGWGATTGGTTTGGHWAQAELDHINVLELKAILMGLHSLCRDDRDTHIRLRSDNTTAVACIDRGGSIKPNLNAVIEQIFDWAQSRGITLSAQYIQGLHNVEADRASRVKNLDTEWMLQPKVFQLLCQAFFTPAADLFATRLNAQLPIYVSWKPDPSATHTNAFTMSWADREFYAFPPFSIVGRVLQKIQDDEATVMTILPLWPTQVWFPEALQLLVAPPLLLPQHSLFLPQDLSLVHPQAHKLVLTAMILSGKLSKIRAFRQKLPDFCFTPGDRPLYYNMGSISRDGCHFVSAGKSILFRHL